MGVCIQAEVAQQAAHHKAQAEAQEAQLHSLRAQLAEHKQAVKQHPWASTGNGTGRLHLSLPGMLVTVGTCVWALQFPSRQQPYPFLQC